MAKITGKPLRVSSKKRVVCFSEEIDKKTVDDSEFSDMLQQNELSANTSGRTSVISRGGNSVHSEPMQQLFMMNVEKKLSEQSRPRPPPAKKLKVYFSEKDRAKDNADKMKIA